MQIAVKMFKSSMCYLIILFAFITPLSKVNANTNFIKKDLDSESSFSSEDPGNLTNGQLESHELMQQESRKLFQVPSSGGNIPKQQNSFLDGKLIIQEDEPLIDEDTTDLLTIPTPTEAMHRDTRQSLQEKEPNPNASESLLELLVMIAGQPERWNKLIGYINTILNSPITINPELAKQLEKYKTTPKTEDTNKIQNSSEDQKHRKLMETYKAIEKNHTDSIQHMIIFLRNENSRKHSKTHNIATSTPKPSTTTTSHKDTMKRKPSEKSWSIFSIKKSNTETKPETEFSDDSDFKFDDKNPGDGQKFIDELHKLNIDNAEFNNLNGNEISSKIVTDTFNTSKSATKNKNAEKYNANRWPVFEEDQDIFNKHIVDSPFSEDSDTTTSKPPVRMKEWFSFRRVTSLPVSGYDKARARNAYIAVSVIAPTMRKYYRSQHKQNTEDDPIVSQLLHLKPWNHRENLKQMKKLREKWPIISTGEPLI